MGLKKDMPRQGAGFPRSGNGPDHRQEDSWAKTVRAERECVCLEEIPAGVEYFCSRTDSIFDLLRYFLGGGVGPRGGAAGGGVTGIGRAGPPPGGGAAGGVIGPGPPPGAGGGETGAGLPGQAGCP